MQSYPANEATFFAETAINSLATLAAYGATFPDANITAADLCQIIEEMAFEQMMAPNSTKIGWDSSDYLW